MPKYLSDSDVFGSNSGGYLAEEDVLGTGAAKSSSAADTIKAIGTGLWDALPSHGKENRKKIIELANEAAAASVNAQNRQGTADELARQDREAAALKIAQDKSHNIAGDAATDLLAGTMQVPGAAATLADLALGQVVTGATPIRDAAQYWGDVTGIQPKNWSNAIQKTPASYSQETNAEKENVNRAWKDSGAEDLSLKLFDFAFGGKATAADLKDAWTNADLSYVAKAYKDNPRASIGTIMQSAPSMLAGGVISRGLMGLAGRFGIPLSAEAAGGIGEGAITAGQNTDQMLDNKVDPRRAAVAGIVSGGITGAIGTASGKVATKIGLPDVNTVMAGGGAGVRKLPLYKSLPTGMVQEGILEELPQSIQEQVFQNWAEKKPLGEGALRSGVEGGIAGAAMSGGVHPFTTHGEHDAGPATPVSGGPEYIDAADVLGTVSPAGTETGTMGGAQQAVQPSESDKALYTPKNLTALDRVNEIDNQFSHEGNMAPEKRAELQSERDSITAAWPKAVPGAETSFSTETGARLAGQYALMEAGDLITSHDESLRPTTSYPVELQPRERERHASELQIQGIVGKLDPARLGESGDVATGAPIVGADGLVESGNARTIALKRVYQANGQKAVDYKDYIKSNADRFGIAPDAVEAMQKPVLVRVRTTPVNRAEFARQANASTVARMSPSEQAKSDAAQIDSLDDLNPDESGDFMSGTSRPFVKRFLSKLAGTEQAGLIDATGQLSQTGYTRIRNAVLAKAYGDSPVLLRMVESLDDNSRNVSKALLRVAPQVAKAREAMGEGALHHVDLIPDLMSAVEELSDLKDKGTSVTESLAQSGMFGDKLSPEAQQILVLLSENARSPRRIAEFIQNYLDALTAAGNPNQGSMFGETAAPNKAELINVARRAINGESTSSPEVSGGVATAQESGSKPADAAGNTASHGSNEAAANNEWVMFPPDSTLGVPRAEMPQVKGEHRGALIQFLKGRGIESETLDMPASDLKPTQAEFSTKKAAQWKEVRNGVDRSVLASSDGYIIDGHHQWVAALALGENVKVIRFNVPIKELMDAVYQFPSVKRSEGAGKPDPRAAANQDFKDAMNDLGAIVRGFAAVARVVPEDTPQLLSTMVRLFDAAIRMGYNDAKKAIAYVKEQLKADDRFKKVWNKLLPQTYTDAARKALDRIDSGVNAKNFVLEIDNYNHPAAESFLPATLVKETRALIEKYRKEEQAPVISPEDRQRAEAMLVPLIAAAEREYKPYIQKIMDLAKEVDALGYMIGPMKTLERSIPKLVVENKFSIDKIRDVLRSTIVISSYAEAQRVVDAIHRAFEVEAGRVKNRTDAEIVSPDLDARTNKFLKSGYGDVLVNVVVNGIKAEIQINMPEMINAKLDDGHKLYEIERNAPAGSDLLADVTKTQRDYYAAAASSAAERKNSSSVSGIGSESGAPYLDGLKSAPSTTNQPLSGSSAKSVSLSVMQNRVPAGNLSGTFIASTSNDSVAQNDLFGYTNNEERSRGAENGQDGNNSTGGPQGKEPGTAATTDAGGKAAGVPGGPVSGNQSADSNADGGTGEQARRGEGQEPAGAGGDTQHGGQDGNRNRPRRNAAVPAGRDIPPKSGRNYVFGDGDLTYAGSWQVKARQNVEAVELLKKLETEGRQATREEQAALAKFIGWGASEIANSIFGEKLTKQLEAIKDYDSAMEYMERSPYGLRQRESGYYQAFQVLAASDPKKYSQHTYYSIDRITKDMLEKAKPDASAKKWGDLRDRLQAAMTDDEWKAASKSTQYAHYTSKPVVKSLLAAVEKMGFKGGAILEPGAGIGVFPGLMSGDMAANSVYTGIEFDPITGGILKQLFPDERILVESFMESKLPENFYDVAFGNPPFSGAFTVLSDPKYVKHAFKLHDYFFAKSIDSVKPGGLVVFVTSRYTMDKKTDKARAYMAERADLIGAIRLPQTAFQKNAGTEVVIDILFLRKKVPGETFEQGQPWAGLGEVQTDKAPALVNEYFAAHPDMVLGKHAMVGKMYAKDGYSVLPNGTDIEAQFAKAIENLPADVFVAGRGSAAEAAKVREMDFNPKAKKEGSFYVSDAGVLMQRERGVGVRAEEKYQKNAAILKDYIGLRDAVKQSQLDQLNDGDWETSLKALQKSYAGFVKKNGRLFQHTAYMQKVKVDELDDEGNPTGQKIDDEEQRRRFPVIAQLRGDPEYTLAMALENFNEETGEISDSLWLTERTLGKPAEADVRTPSDALLATLNDTGEVNIPAIAQRLGMTEQETVDALGTLVYEDPAQGWVMADEYLSGNVKKKLAAAEEAVKSNKSLARNVQALKDAQPAPRSPEQITPQIGMNWIPGGVYEQFLEDIAGVKAKIEYVPRTREWTLTPISGESSLRATNDWGVGDRAHAGWLMEKALSGAPIRMNMSVPDGKGGSKLVFDANRTEAAIQKRRDMRDKFQEWLFQDANRTTELVQLYNDKFNTTVQRKFDGSHLTLPGTSKLFNIFDHVKRGAWRVIQTGNTYLAHAVGSGKTFEVVISAMEQKRLGKIKKPMVIVPGHMLQQFASEWQQLYPTARLMVADETDFHTDNRRRFVSRVAMSDLDGVIMTHSSFGLLDLDPVFKQKMIEQELEVMRASYVEAGGDLDDIGDKKQRKDPKIKRIEAQIEKLEQQLAKAMSSEGKDKNVRFDEMGVDMLYVDEAHLFRKLSYATARQMKGIDPAGSQMAWDLYMKTRWLAEKNPTRNLVMASGTPITNTTAELYTVQRFMAPQVLEDNGLSGFDDWASQFGEEATTIESTASGKYEPVTRFQEFVNVGEMTQMFRDFADVLTEDQLAALLGDKRPKVQGGGRKSVITPKTETYTTFLREDLAPRIEASRKFKPSFETPYNPDPIIAINVDARLAAIDMRFMQPSLPSDPDSKLNRLIDGVIRVYKETANNEYLDKQGKPEALKGATQMVFFESGFGKMVAQRRGFNARAWMEKRLRDAGIPASQVAFMEDYKKSSAKLKLFADVNKGKVRVLVGSSAAMGTGVNAQQRLIALHHLDAPMVPAILEQREGRIVRQGNKNPKVQLYAYSMFGSFDENQWSMLARKKFFIEQAMSGDPNIRSIEDVGVVNELELAAGLVAENPYVMQHAGAKAEVEKLVRLYRNHEEQRARMQEDYQNAARSIAYNETMLPAAEKAAAMVKDLHGDAFTAKADGKDYATRKEWGVAALVKFKELTDKLTVKNAKVGEISGFDVVASGILTGKEYRADLRLMTPTPVYLAHDALVDPTGMATRAVNALVELSREPAAMRKIVSEMQAKRNALEPRLDAPFPLAEQLANKIKETEDLRQQVMSYGKAPVASLTFNSDEWANATTMFSRGTGSGMALRDLQAVVDRVVKGFKNLPRVHVLSSPAELSTKDPGQKALRDFIRKQGANDDAEGATHDGEIYLFASGLADEARAEHVLATHELTHYGLRGAIGKDMDAALQHVLLMNAPVRKAAMALKTKYGLTSNLDAVEEVLADIPTADLAKLTGWRKVVQVVRNWLNRAGAKSLAAKLDQWMKAGLSEQRQADLFVADLVTAAREWAKTGKGGSGAPVMGGTHLAADKTLAEDSAGQEKWLDREAKMRGYKSIDDLAEKAYPVFEKLAAKWREQNPVEHALLSRSGTASTSNIRHSQTANKTAEEIIQQKAATARPLDAVIRGVTQAARVDRVTMAAYDKAAALLDRYTPETIKAGIVSDYGIPEAVMDQRAITQGRQKEQTRAAGALLEKLATLTRAESRVAYDWMNTDNPQSSDYFMDQLPPESVKTLAEVEKMIDDLSKEAVRLGQLSPDAYQKNRFSYLHRSYVKHTAELTKGETAMRKRAIAILGDQYKGRGMTDSASMKQIQNLAPEWWNRKTQAGKADKQLKGEKFVRLERRQPVGQGVAQMPGFTPGGQKAKLLEVAYWPASEPVPARYGAWERAGTWEVRDTKGANLVLWRDFTKQEREGLGEIDEVRYAIAKTLHGMIHDVETGKYLQWLGQNYAKKEGEKIDGTIVDASDRMRDVYKTGEWVKVPESPITGTQVKKYGTLAGRYLPGPIWNDVRQVVGFRYQPLGETYAKIHRAWKTSKTALSPAVHMNNVMANFVMADWHDVSAGHVLKALKLMLSKEESAGEILARFGDSGGSIGTWAAKELQQEQMRPILDALEKELGIAGNAAGQVGVMSALQLALRGQFPSAWEAIKPSAPGRATVKAAQAMLSMYEAEDQVFRLATWLKAKEEGASDIAAGKLARKAFLDYSINAPWVQMMRSTALPFVAFTYRAAPMLLETAAKKPWKLLKLGLIGGAINALGYMLSGGDEDDERKLLPEEKAGRVWGITPKLLRMPWNDANGSPVFLDVRRWVPVGDFFDAGQSHAAIPLLPFMQPGGPLAMMAELALDQTQFTGKSITLETDTPLERAQKTADYLYKAFAPNIAILPGTYSWTSIANAGSGKTDSFGREQSLTQSIVSSLGVKLGSYPKDVLQLNAQREAQFKLMEIDRNITALKREYQKHGLTGEEFQAKATAQMDKKRAVMKSVQDKMMGGK